MKCDCGNEVFDWSVSRNEEGWTCLHCGEKPGEPPGFCPQLDYEDILRKVEGILDDLHNHAFVYVSNGSEGEFLAGTVADICKVLGRYDQYTIIREIFACNDRHGDYWKKISDGIREGKDPRNRCHCGKLATLSSGGNHWCKDHYDEAWSGDAP